MNALRIKPICAAVLLLAAGGVQAQTLAKPQQDDAQAAPAASGRT